MPDGPVRLWQESAALTSKSTSFWPQPWNGGVVVDDLPEIVVELELLLSH
jgi:hypothetical protein